MSSSELGYIFDFLAGIWIIQSVVFRSQRHIEVETQQLWDGNPLLHESQLKAFWDGWIGIIQLLVGLFLHLLHFETTKVMGVILIAITIIISVSITFLTKRLIERMMEKKYPSSYAVVKKRALGLEK